MTGGLYRTVYGEAFAVPDDGDGPGLVPDGAVTRIDQARQVARLTPHQLADRALLPGNTVAAILADSRQATPGQVARACAPRWASSPTAAACDRPAQAATPTGRRGHHRHRRPGPPSRRPQPPPACRPGRAGAGHR